MVGTIVVVLNVSVVGVVTVVQQVVCVLLTMVVVGTTSVDVRVSVVVSVFVESYCEVDTVVDCTMLVLTWTEVTVVEKVTVVIMQHAPEVDVVM